MKTKRILAAVVAGQVLLSLIAGGQTLANRYPFAKGVIEALIPAKKEMVVKTPKGSTTFTITNRTYVIVGQANVGFDKLKVGDLVKINYYTNATGRAIVRRLKVASPETEAEASFE